MREIQLYPKITLLITKCRLRFIVLWDEETTIICHFQCYRDHFVHSL